MREWLYAIEGYKAKMGVNEASDPLTSDGLESLMERYPDVVNRDVT